MTDLEEIKKRLDIVTLISEYVPLKKTGANFKGLCPFHSEKTPSFVVSAERQIWHCFGGCQDGGDIFRFLMRLENIEFSEAVKILAKRTGVPVSTSFQSSKQSEIKEKVLEINHLAAEYFHFILTTHPVGQIGRNYFKERRISDSSIKLFKLGFAPNSWNSLTNFLRKKGYSDADLLQAGVVSKSSIGNIFDRFRGRVIFTLFDHYGSVVGFAGRLLDPEAKEAKYINTAETPAYTKGNTLYGLDVTKEEIKKSGFAVVVEGEIDAIASYQAGVRNVVAIKGSALTLGQVNLLRRYTEVIYLSLDADFAGDAAAHRGIEIADQAGLGIKVVSFKEGKDPDELIKKDPALWHKAVKEAGNFYDFVIDSALTKSDSKTAEGAKKIISDVARFLAPIDNLVVKNHYVKRLAEELGVRESDVEGQLFKDWRKKQLPTPTQIAPPATDFKKKLTQLELSQEYLLELLLQSPKPEDYLLLIAPRLLVEDFTDPGLGKIYQLLLSLVANPKSDVTLPTQRFDIKTFINFVPPELIDTVDRLFLKEIDINIEDEALVLEEVQKKAWDIKQLSLQRKQDLLREQIKRDGDNEQLQQQLTELLNEGAQLKEERQLITASIP